MRICDDIDTGDGPTTRADLSVLDSAEARRWHDIREGAQVEFDRGAEVLYASAPGVVHRVSSLRDLARVTRVERRRVRARWPEDAN